MIRGRKLTAGKQLKGCLIYPDLFENGIANLGWQDIVWRCSDYVDWRILFSDEEITLYGEPLDICLEDADIVLVSLPFESTYLEAVKMLKKYNLIDKKRKPFIIGGGMSSINPFPLSRFVDAFIIGNGSHVMLDIIKIIAKEDSKTNKLSEIIQLDGVFSLSSKSKMVKAQVFSPNDIYYSHWTSDKSCYEFVRYFSIMTSMGCNGVCPYCVVGNTQGNEKHNAINYSFDSVDAVLDRELPYHDPQVVKLFFASGEPHIADVIRRFASRGINVRVGSLNIRQLNDSLLEQLKQNGQTEVTIAPETIQSLRKSIGKGYLTDELLLEKIDLVSNHKMDLTLYYLCGLVDECKSDIKLYHAHIDDIVNHIRPDTNVNIHFNPLFPKAQTPMQNYKMLNLDLIRERYEMLKEKLSADYRFSITSIIDDPLAFYQSILSLGDERVGDVIYQLCDIKNPSEEDWKSVFENVGIYPNEYISSTYDDRRISKSQCFSTIKY